MSERDFEQADQLAAHYDDSAEEHGWHSPELLFGLMYEFLQPNDSLLDIGIGTGLSAVPFHNAGLRVVGIDGSAQMLEQCRSKGVAAELRQHDIRAAPIPHADQSFNHVVACGVFHLIDYLDGVVNEAARLLVGGGAFAFTIEELKNDEPPDGVLIHDGVLEVKNEKSGVVSYLHGRNYIESLLERCGFRARKTLDYVAYRETEWAAERMFRAYVTLKSDDLWMGSV